MSYGGLARLNTSSTVQTLYFADIVNGIITKVEEPLEDFLLRWRYNYHNSAWDYSRDLEEGIPVPQKPKERG